jgi:UDP-galactopyranose mutase
LEVNKLYDYLIVGAGLAGCTIASYLSEYKNKDVLVIDSNNFIGGFCYDYFTEDKEYVQTFGLHAFRTNNRDIVKYLSHYTELAPYFHKVKGYIDGKLVSIPFNFNTLYELLPEQQAQHIEKCLLSIFEYDSEITIKELKDAGFAFLSDYIVKKIYKNYSEKQWDCKFSDLSDNVINRVKIRLNRDDNYFTEKYQFVPSNGYTKMMTNMLALCDVKLGMSYGFIREHLKDKYKYDKLIWTGSIDKYYNYEFGELDYRSVYFEGWDNDNQEYATVNYPNNFDFTRKHNYGIIFGDNKKRTYEEYPIWYPCSGEAFTIHGMKQVMPSYPIDDEENNKRYAQYKELADEETNVFFAGRLGNYKYISMDQCIEQSLKLAEEL